MKPVRDPGLVVGASYSHADMLKFDNLYVRLVGTFSIADLIKDLYPPQVDQGRLHLHPHRKFEVIPRLCTEAPA